MPKVDSSPRQAGSTAAAVDRKALIGLLNEDLAREYQAIIAKQSDYLGGTPAVVPKPVKLSDKPEALLRFDLENETETIRQYRTRVRQCEALGATALGEDPPDMSG